MPYFPTKIPIHTVIMVLMMSDSLFVCYPSVTTASYTVVPIRLRTKTTSRVVTVLWRFGGGPRGGRVGDLGSVFSRPGVAGAAR